MLQRLIDILFSNAEAEQPTPAERAIDLVQIRRAKDFLARTNKHAG
jgi:hypothetical protein